MERAGEPFQRTEKPSVNKREGFSKIAVQTMGLSYKPILYFAMGQLPPEQAPVEQGLGAAGAAAGAGLPLP